MAQDDSSLTVAAGTRLTFHRYLHEFRNSLKQVRWFVHFGLILSCLLIGLPLLYALTTATHTSAEIFSYPPKLGFGTQLANNVETVLNDFGLMRFMLNSTFVALAVTLGKTVMSLLAGTAFVYFDFPLKGPLFFFVLITLMMPTHVLIVALFQLVSDLEWGNTYWALIMPFLASATGTFLFRQHFSNIPAELADAARIDGAGPMRFLWRVLVPLSWNTIGALAVIQFVYMWNQYLWPRIIINENDRQVVQVGLNMLISGQDATDWGPVMAGAVIATLPPLIVFVLLQRQFLSGFAFSTEK
jgi:sn-glycerol 3-phosphate transport system permease protein